MGEASMRKWMRRARRHINAVGGLCVYWRPVPALTGPRPRNTGDVARRLRLEHRNERRAERWVRAMEKIRRAMSEWVTELKAEMLRCMLERSRA